jgi:hypothetical protein
MRERIGVNRMMLMGGLFSVALPLGMILFCSATPIRWPSSGRSR